jgi:hypothetical protein
MKIVKKNLLNEGNNEYMTVMFFKILYHGTAKQGASYFELYYFLFIAHLTYIHTIEETEHLNK